MRGVGCLNGDPDRNVAVPDWLMGPADLDSICVFQA
jgi:hypothetical protein